MKTTDEELQRQIEKGDFSSQGIDAHAYQKVFGALKREPEYRLPLYFADRVIDLVEEKTKAKESALDKFWMGLALFAFLIGLIITFAITGFKLSVGAFLFISGYQGLVIFGAAFILLLNWIEKKIVKARGMEPLN